AGGLKNAAQDFSQTLWDGAMKGDIAWEDFGKRTLQMFGQMITQALILQAITGSVTGAAGAGGYGGLFALLGIGGGATGFDSMARAGLNLPGFATGGDALVRGAGGTDSTLAMFRVTPGESIHV